MPRGSSRQFRELYDGAANRLGISGATPNRVDSVFLARARGALKSQGFAVDGRNVSRIFQERGDLAQAELGLSPFTAQTQSVNFPTAASTDALRNSTDQVIGIANVWSVGCWFKPTAIPPAGTEFLWSIRPQGAGAASQLILYQDSSSNRLRFDIADQSGSPLEVTAFNNFYTGEAGNWVHILVAWTGTQFFVLKNGVDFGSPDVGTATPAITMADTARSISLGNVETPTALSIRGNVAQLQVFNADVRSAAPTIVAGASAFNLNAASGAYTFQGNLAHWYRAGNEAAPTIGRDYAEAGITPTISLDANSVGIIDGDRQADVP